MKNKKMIIGLVILAVGVVTMAAGYVLFNNNAADQPGTTKLTQGTQMNYEDISIGLSSIENDTAWLSVRSKETNESTSKQAKAGDKIDVYGYQIAISSVKKGSNLSTVPGSNQGYVKFVVNKK